jgi:hypothetical protein
MKTVNEKLASEIVRHRHLAIGVENDIQRKLWAEVRKAEKEVLARLVEATAKPLNKHDIALLTTQIRVDLAEAQDKVTQELGKQLAGVAGAETSATGALLQATLPAVVAKKAVMRKMPVRVVDDILKMPVHGVTYKQAIRNMFGRLGAKIDKTAQDAFGEAFHKELLAGKTFGVAKKNALDASGILASKTGDISQLFTKGAQRDLKTIVHGHVQHTLDAAQTKVFQDNNHLLQGVVFTATLDRKTCSVCAGLDGTMYWMGKIPKGQSGLSFAEKPALPMHPGCRCCYAPIVKSWQDLPVDKVSKTDKTDKKVLDGDIPRPKKYEDWFAEQSKSTQVDILGPTKYELWKSGQVKLSDMAVMDKPLTVEELRAKAGLVSEERGLEFWMNNRQVIDSIERVPSHLMTAQEGDTVLKQIVKEQWGEAMPQVVSSLDDMVRAGSRELFRGNSNRAFAEQLMRGDLHVGLGKFGNGTYVAYGKEGKATAAAFSSSDQGVVTRMVMKPDARIINYDDAVKIASKMESDALARANALTDKAWDAHAAGDKALRGKLMAEAERAEKFAAHVKDPGKAAAMAGYDAIDVPAWGEMCVMNRAVLIFEELP